MDICRQYRFLPCAAVSIIIFSYKFLNTSEKNWLNTVFNSSFVPLLFQWANGEEGEIQYYYGRLRFFIPKTKFDCCCGNSISSKNRSRNKENPKMGIDTLKNSSYFKFLFFFFEFLLHLSSLTKYIYSSLILLRCLKREKLPTNFQRKNFLSIFF